MIRRWLLVLASCWVACSGDVPLTDLDGDGIEAPVDCDDRDPNVRPGLAEVVGDGLDNDCDPSSLDDDLDGDAFGRRDGDCDDRDPMRFPGAVEIPYDGIDQDCSGSDLEDRDGDGFAGGADGDDCDDTRIDVSPAGIERCGDGIDQDCDGEDVSCDAVDRDGDGFATSDGDCRDRDPDVNPGATEVPYDGVDQDCDASTPDDDLDGDGWRRIDDCDDGDSAIHPSAIEVPYDGIDQDCTSGDLLDVDGDGSPAPEDCDDRRADVHPGAEEIPLDEVDQDCDGRDTTGDVFVVPAATDFAWDGTRFAFLEDDRIRFTDSSLASRAVVELPRVAQHLSATDGVVHVAATEGTRFFVGTASEVAATLEEVVWTRSGDVPDAILETWLEGDRWLLFVRVMREGAARREVVSGRGSIVQWRDAGVPSTAPHLAEGPGAAELVRGAETHLVCVGLSPAAWVVLEADGVERTRRLWTAPTWGLQTAFDPVSDEYVIEVDDPDSSTVAFLAESGGGFRTLAARDFGSPELFTTSVGARWLEPSERGVRGLGLSPTGEWVDHGVVLGLSLRPAGDAHTLGPGGELFRLSHTLLFRYVTR